MLKDLSQIIDECRQRYDALSYNGDIHMDKTLADLIESEFKKVEPKSTFQMNPFSISLKNEDGLKTDLPSSLLWYGHAFWPLSDMLDMYKNVQKEAEEYLKTEGYSSSDIKAFFKQLPSPNADYSAGVGHALNKYISKLPPRDGDLYKRFLSDREWWFKPLKASEQKSGKTLDRSDVFQSSFDLAARVIVANSSRLILFAKIFKNSQTLRDYFAQYNPEPVTLLGSQTAAQHNVGLSSDSFIGYNKIFYGAPGTGKSHAIKQGHDEKYLIRTVFHPDTQYSDFVGCLKPIMLGANVGYQFRPGPFTTAVIKAINDPSSKYFLVIEEINRSAAAAVFGEIFQLLDRNKKGESEYDIELSDPDLLAYLNQETQDHFDSGKLKIPANLSLLATMNSSDQAVMPMDTAFKRRWQFEYLQIDYSNASKGKLALPIESSGTVSIESVEWSIFAKVINDRLSSERIPEDRLLGHRFISEVELIQSPSNALKGKLLMYLWDDVLRHGQQSVIFRDTVVLNGELIDLVNFGQLVTAFSQGSAIFNNSIEESLVSLVDVPTTEESLVSLVDVPATKMEATDAA